jgi:hypothetical protein
MKRIKYEHWTEEQVVEHMGKSSREMNDKELRELLENHDADHDGNGRYPLGACTSELVFHRKSSGEPCSRTDLITDEYPRAELNPDCEMVLDMDGLMYDFDSEHLDRVLDRYDFGSFITYGDVACAEGMKWDVEFEVKARYVQVPIEKEVTV